MHTPHYSPAPPAFRSGTSHSKFPRLKGRRGTAIVATLIIVVVVTALVGVTFVATNAATRMGGRAKDYVAAQRAAEAAVEYGYGIWKRRIFVANGAINTVAANATLSPPILPGYAFETVANHGPLTISATDAYGAPTASPVSVPVSLPDYPNWRGYSTGYLVSAKVKSVGQIGSVETAGVKRRFSYVEVPVFQMMYFFNDNLEFYKPATMIIGGLVHTNADLYASSSNAGTLTFSGSLSYGGNYSSTQDPPYANTWSGWSSNAEITPTFTTGTQATQVTKVPVAQPLGLSMQSFFNTTDSNPNNDGYQEIIQMPDPAYTDPPEIASRRMYNKAGVMIAVNSTTTTTGSGSTAKTVTTSTATVTTQNGTTATATQLSTLASAFTGKTTIFDQREGKSADVSNIDVSKLTPVLNALSSSGGFNGLLYIVDTTPVTTSGTNPSPNPKTVRLQNGGILPDNGLTIASQNPIYIQGDYNTGTSASKPPTSVPANATGNPNNTDSPTVSGYTRKPSAVMGDAVMLLSNAWNDTNSSLSVSSRNASNTTYNTAILSGYMPSGYTPTSGSQYGYSGGGCNFPRFLEDWSGQSCTYYGSMVELFKSSVFTGKWDTGNIYSPPYRRWNFDTNFSTNAPPGSLVSVVYTRGTWSKF